MRTLRNGHVWANAPHPSIVTVRATKVVRVLHEGQERARGAWPRIRRATFVPEASPCGRRQDDHAAGLHRRQSTSEAPRSSRRTWPRRDATESVLTRARGS